MAALKLGLISPLWPPRGGGGEVYLQRVGIALAGLGVNVSACVGVMAPEQVSGLPVSGLSSGFGGDVDPDDPASCRSWFLEVSRWLDEVRPTHLLINAPLTRVSHAHAAELYALARRRGCRIGAVHLDLDRGVVEALAAAYGATGSWERAAQVGERQLDALAADLGSSVYEEIGSPLFFDVDFILSCSAWSDRFIDPLGRVPRIVFHPPMGDAMAGPVGAPMGSADFGFVNPRPHKGGRTLAEIIQRAPADWRFRGLEGGHGSAFSEFGRAIEGAASPVELIRRVDDMRDYYDGIGALLVASVYEGYGMVGVEAMIRGTPVLARDYPAIREAVGDGALIVGFDATSVEWLEAMARLRADRGTWIAAARRRVTELAAREIVETVALRNLLLEV
jgi:glycosyltransferase involved in cell wall biosynthesis